MGRLALSRFRPILIVCVLLSAAAILAAMSSCSASDGAAPAEVESTPAPPKVDNVRWLLQSLDGPPLIDGTFITLTLNGDRYSGFDGCNTFGGRHDDGTSVASPDGTFTTPNETASTLIGCRAPEGILDQAGAYLMALRQSSRFRLTENRLETLDESGEVRLVFLHQEPLPGAPARLEGTGWRLLAEDDLADGVRVPSLTILDANLFEGTTACRDVEGSYQTSGKSIRFPNIGMNGDHSACSEGVMRHEAQFTDDLSYSIEYSVYRHEEAKRLVIRTSRGRALTFESLPPLGNP